MPLVQYHASLADYDSYYDMLRTGRRPRDRPAVLSSVGLFNLQHEKPVVHISLGSIDGESAILPTLFHELQHYLQWTRDPSHLSRKNDENSVRFYAASDFGAWVYERFIHKEEQP